MTHTESSWCRFAIFLEIKGIFKAAQDCASPFDGDGRGTRTAAIVAGNHGVSIIVVGHEFGNVGGMAPRSLVEWLLVLSEENMELKKRKDHCCEEYSWSDYMSLKFTQNVISETLRLANIINAVWRKALKDVKIKGYLIPEGWCVLASMSSVHMDKTNFENPLEFDPWRWKAEVNFLGDLVHPYLVKLVGYRIKDDQRLLVYEFMPQGSLENHLFRTEGRAPRIVFHHVSVKKRREDASGTFHDGDLF